ncbi:MAG: PAS domain S-box protein [Emticicia sp.]|nr:PAS domain S-box protein [Emticicia sp.]
MSEALQYLAFISIVLTALVVVFSLMKNSFVKYRHIYINNIKDLSKHYYRYVLYFWGVGIFVPFSEFYLDLFSVRKESELTYNLIVGLFCLGIAFFSKYFAFIRNNLHRFFAAFFVVYNSLVIYKIATMGQMDFLTLAEFTLVNMISYYVFYSFKYFYTYLLAIVVALLGLVFSGIISTKDFIIYFNSSFIAFIINYVIHYIDLSIKENLFFAYNFVNRGNLLIIGVNQEGIITFVSKNVEEVLGYNTDEWIGQNWESEIQEKLGFEKNDNNKIKKIKVKEGSYKFLDWHEEVFNNDLILKVGRDVTDIKKTETQLITTNNRLNSLLANIGDLVFVLNLDYVFTEYYQNENNEDLLVPPSVFLGKSINEIGFPDDALKALKAAIDKTITTHKKTNVEYSLPTEAGRQWFSVVISPLDDDDGNLTEIICIARNITDNKKAELELKRTKEVLEQTNRVARVGGWEYNLLEQKIYSSKITKEIFEVIAESESGFSQVISYFEEGESRDLLLNAINKCIGEGVPYDLELAIITANRKKHWVRAKGAAEFVDGVCRRVYGIVQDIDEQVKAKTALKQSEEKFRYISENISDVVIVFENNKVSYLSSAHERQFGYTTEEAIAISERNIYDFFHPEDHEFLRNLYRNAIKSQTPKLTYNTRFLHKNGSYIWREDSVTLIYDSTGYLTMRLVTARDISDRKNQEIANQQRQERVLLQNNILIRLSKTHLNEDDFWGRRYSYNNGSGRRRH